MKVNEKTPATIYPITLDDAKTQCRVIGTTHDAVITGIIKAATRYVQRRMGVTIMTTTWEMYLDGFADPISLPYPPVKSVKIYYMPDGSTDYTELATGEYYVDNVCPTNNAELVINDGHAWPAVENHRNAVKIEYVAGETTGTSVKENVRHAVNMATSWMFEHRGDEGLVEIPSVVDDLIFPESNMCV
jgi:uncharacterized phiE125 gp8 family phage protein